MRTCEGSKISHTVFNSHVIGKMYLENRKQFHDRSSLSGEAGHSIRALGSILQTRYQQGLETQ